MAKLKEGAKAPAFTLMGNDGKKHSLKEFAGKTLVLYFYPKDNTSGCTAQALAFTAAAEKAAAMNAVIAGVSRDSLQSHEKFAAKNNLGILLLSDPDAAVCEKYGVFKGKTLYGKKHFGIERSTFLIGPDGKIKKIWRAVRVPGHADAVLAEIERPSGEA